MDLKVLAVGDVVGNPGMDRVKRSLRYLKRQTNADFVVVDLLRDGEGQDIHFGDAPCVLFHDAHHVYDGLLRELADKSEVDGPFDWLERLSLCFKLLCNMARDTNRHEMDTELQRIQRGITYLENNYSASTEKSAL